jgi:hypothetical protein
MLILDVVKHIIPWSLWLLQEAPSISQEKNMKEMYVKTLAQY